MVGLFGTTKVEKGGSRDVRYDHESARVRFEPGTGLLELGYAPKHMGSNIFWKNPRSTWGRQ